VAPRRRAARHARVGLVGTIPGRAVLPDSSRPGQLLNWGNLLGEPHGRVHFGARIAPPLKSYMEGARVREERPAKFSPPARVSGASAGLRVAFPVSDPTCYRITAPDPVAFTRLWLRKRRELPFATRRSTSSSASGRSCPSLELTYNSASTLRARDRLRAIAVTVDDMAATLAATLGQGNRAREAAVQRCGRADRSFCFVRDPDQYRVELIERA